MPGWNAPSVWHESSPARAAKGSAKRIRLNEGVYDCFFHGNKPPFRKRHKQIVFAFSLDRTPEKCYPFFIDGNGIYRSFRASTFLPGYGIIPLPCQRGRFVMAMPARITGNTFHSDSSSICQSQFPQIGICAANTSCPPGLAGDQQSC